MALPPVDVVPEPPRPLEPAGRRFWDETWRYASGWLGPTDAELVLMAAEAVDEREGLRPDVSDWRQRTQLRNLENELVAIFCHLGMSPASRSRLGVAAVDSLAKLDRLHRPAQSEND